MTDKREQFETIKAKYYAGRSGRALDVRDDYIAILEQAARAAPAQLFPPENTYDPPRPQDAPAQATTASKDGLGVAHYADGGPPLFVQAAPAHPDCFNCGHAAHSGDCVNVAPARPAEEPIHWEPSIEDDK